MSKQVRKTETLLKLGWVTSLECAAKGGCLSLSQRVSEWRRDGANIIDKWVTTEAGARVKAYKWLGPGNRMLTLKEAFPGAKWSRR